MKKIWNGFRWSGRWLWEHQKPVVLATALLLPVGLLSQYITILLPSSLLESLLGAATFSQAVGGVLWLALALLLLSIAKRLLEEYQRHVITRLNQHAIQRKTAIVLRSDYETLEDTTFQEQLQNIHRATWGSAQGSVITQGFTLPLEFLGYLLAFLLFGALLLQLSPWISLLLFAASFVEYILTQRLEIWQQEDYKTVATIDRQMNYITHQSSDSRAADDIRIYSMQLWLNDKFSRLAAARQAWETSHRRRLLKTQAIGILLRYLALLVSVILLFSNLFSQAITISEFVFYFGLLLGFMSQLQQGFLLVGTLEKNSLLIDDFLTFFQHQKQLPSAERWTLDHIPPTLQAKNLCYQYEGETSPTLKNISFTIRPGEKIAIVGLNGAGKTTLIKVLCGLYQPTSGQVILDSKEVHHIPVPLRYQPFSAVFQDYTVLPVTLAENISCQPKEQTDQHKVEKVLTQVGLRDKVQGLPQRENTYVNPQIHKDGIRLSGGEEQRLILARALYKDAPVLVLDEPTAALDPLIEEEIYQKYHQLTKEKTSIFISHRLASTQFCDRIFYLRDGEISETGSHKELLALGGEYASLFATQSQYYKEGAGHENH